MADLKIWDGTIEPVIDHTIYKYFDSDADFLSDSVKFAKFAASRLGYPIMDVELQCGQFYIAFESAVMEYSAEVNQFVIKENMINLQGLPLTNNLTHKLVLPQLGRLIKLSEAYANEVHLGKNVIIHRSSIDIKSEVQRYNVMDWILPEHKDDNIIITKVFHNRIPAVTRFYDPFAGTGMQNYNAMNGEFGWAGMSPGTEFVMMPLHGDLLRTQAIEISDMVRRSSYGFEISGNEIIIQPIPKSDHKCFFEYRTEKEKYNYEENIQTDVISDMSNAPFDNMVYTAINSIGRSWIREYALALCKEMLGLIRGKFGSVNIPGDETTLDGDALRSEASAQKDLLITQLREILDQISRKNLLEQQKEEVETVQQTMKSIPFYVPIKIG